jgi:hypothetical protein
MRDVLGCAWSIVRLMAEPAYYEEAGLRAEPGHFPYPTHNGILALWIVSQTS